MSLTSDKLLEIQQLAQSLLQKQPVTVHLIMTVLGKTTFCENGHAQICQWCCVIWNDMFTVNVYHCPAD